MVLVFATALTPLRELPTAQMPLLELGLMLQTRFRTATLRAKLVQGKIIAVVFVSPSSLE
jgi:hypothetical protein